MKKIKIGIYLPEDHPLLNSGKGKRAATIYQILDDWYEREQRMANIEESLQRI